MERIPRRTNPRNCTNFLHPRQLVHSVLVELRISATGGRLDGYKFQEICDYTFEDDETIYTGHFLDLYETMTTSSEFNILQLEAPRDLLQITDATPRPEQAVEIANPTVWVRTLVRQQQQAASDLQRLTQLYGDAFDRTDRRTQETKQAYQTLAEGTRYVYDRVNANEKIAKEWIRSELSSAANAYQSLARNVRQAIIERTNEANERQICQATQLVRVNDALSFLAEANTARNQHLANFQGNVELWAAAHQNRVSNLENQLREARAEIQRIATRIPLPAMPPVPLHGEAQSGRPAPAPHQPTHNLHWGASYA